MGNTKRPRVTPTSGPETGSGSAAASGSRTARRKRIVRDTGVRREPENVPEPGPAGEPAGEPLSDVCFYKRKKTGAIPNAASLTMEREPHPWLNWPNCTPNRIIDLNNRLALHQHKPLGVPRYLDWDLVKLLGIDDKLEELFTTRYETDHEPGSLTVPIWTRAFSIRERVYRDWCLEFYSSIYVDKQFQLSSIGSAEVVHFRLGGKERHMTLAQFGLHAGLFTQEEVDNPRMEDYLAEGVLTSTEFCKTVNHYWYALSGRDEKHKSDTARVADLTSGILRFIARYISYGFFHRGTQNDKVYPDDLWLLNFFDDEDQDAYPNVPYALACYMEKRGPGLIRRVPSVVAIL